MILFNIKNKEEILTIKDRLEKKWDYSTQMIDKAYHDLGLFADTKEFKKKLKAETNKTSIPRKAATHLLVPLPLNFVADYKATNSKVTKDMNEFAESVEQSWECFVKYKSEVTPLPMIDNYLSALDKRKVLVCKDGKYYLDVAEGLEKLGCESIVVDELA